MSQPVPDTLDEAKAKGREFRGNNAELIKYGAPVETWDCATHPAGSKCMVFKCVDGWVLVAYCNGAKGCTEFYEVRCPS